MNETIRTKRIKWKQDETASMTRVDRETYIVTPTGQIAEHKLHATVTAAKRALNDR